MPWLIVDVAIALFAIVFLLAVIYRLWRQVASFGKNAAAAAERLNAASAALDDAQRQGPVRGA